MLDRGPVYFVARCLRRSWPELGDEDAWMSLGEVPAVRWGPGENIWTVSTYLRLKAAGADVKIVDRLVPGHVNVAYDDRVLGDAGAERSFVVALYGDRCYARWGNFGVVQSPAMLSGREDEMLMDMWPQPGLKARDGARGSRVERVGYVGPAHNLAEAFRSRGFARDLKSLGVELVLRTHPRRWDDYSDLDVVLGVRDLPWAWVRTKPATKLVHAWLSGCVAMLGCEPAYRSLGESGEDYFEVRRPEDVLRWVAELKRQPAVFERMRARGARRARWHDERAVCARWQAMLSGPVQACFERWLANGGGRTFGSQWRCGVRRQRALVSRKLFFARVKVWPQVKRSVLSG